MNIIYLHEKKAKYSWFMDVTDYKTYTIISHDFGLVTAI